MFQAVTRYTPTDNWNGTGIVSDAQFVYGIDHCLLEDDNLITSLSVKVNRLRESSNTSEVILLISVTVNAIRGTF